MVQIYVGPNRALWVLPEHALCDRVNFFKSAFQTGFRESSEKVLELPEDCPVAFEYVIEHVLQGCADGDIIERLKDPEDIHMAWCRTWVLADKLGCPKISIDAEHSYCQFLFSLQFQCRIASPAAVKFLYENSSDSCVLRKKLAKVAADTYQDIACFCDDFMDRWSESAVSHPKFLSDIMILLKRKLPEKQRIDVGCRNASCRK
jgi:hypothetical protein